MWAYWLCADNLRYRDVTVVCNKRNIGVFEFFRDYLWNCENLKVTLDCGKEKAESINAGPWNREQKFYLIHSRFSALAEVTGNSFCFQSESRAHGKSNSAFHRLSYDGNGYEGYNATGYSIGVVGERIVHNTLAFHSRSISDVARLLYFSDGMIGTFSSMALFASLLGKQVLVVNYEGGIVPDNATGFPSLRCRILNSSDPEEIAHVAMVHLGQYLKVR